MKETHSDIESPQSDFSLDETTEQVQQHIAQSLNGVWKKDVQDILNFIEGDKGEKGVVMKTTPRKKSVK